MCFLYLDFFLLEAVFIAVPQLEGKHLPEIRQVLGGEATLGDEQCALLAQEHEEILSGLVHIHDVVPGVQRGGTGLFIQHIDAVIIEYIAHGVADEGLIILDKAAGRKLRQEERTQHGDDRHDGDDGGLLVYLKIGIDADDGDQQQQNVHHYAVFILSACHKAGKGKVISALHNSFGSDFNIHGFYLSFRKM